MRDIFITRLDAWIADASTVDQLLNDLNRALGYVWFPSSEIHDRVWETLDDFATTVRGMDGMTVDERLSTFGLLERWAGSSEEVRRSLRAQILATSP